MSAKEPRSFDSLENDTKKFQEEKYMDSLMGRALGENDPRSEQRREEAKEYDDHLRALKERGDTPEDFVDSSNEVNSIQKKIDFVSQQIEKIEAQTKNGGDQEADRRISVKDLEAKKSLRSNLIAQLQKENDVLLGKSDHPVIDPNKVADLKQKIEDETNTAVLELDAPTANNPPEGPKPHDIPPQSGEGIVTPVNIAAVSSENAPKDPSERKKWRTRLLAAGAIIATGAILSWVTIGSDNDNKKNQRADSNDKAGQTNPNSPNAQNDNDQRLKDLGLRYNRFEPHARDRMSTEGAFDGTERNMAELDNHVLAKIKNNPSLMSAVLEVRESGNKDANFSLADVNQDTRKFSVHGEHGEYSAKGEKAVDTLERSWDRGHQGELLSENEVRKLMSKYVFINHGTDSGNFKNAIDDRTYDAGKFDYRPDLGDQIYKKKLGNGETVYFKVNEKDPTRDCLNVQTLREKGVSNPVPETGGGITTEQTDEFIGDIEGPDLEFDPAPEIDDDKKAKEAPQGHDNGSNNAQTPQETVNQDIAGNTPGGNQTNPAPVQNPGTTTPPTAETGTPAQNSPASGTATKP